MDNVEIITDALTGLGQVPSNSVQLVITSPPYYHQRKYGTPTNWPTISYRPLPDEPYTIELPEWHGELGQESTPREYIGHLLLVFEQLWQVLCADGCIFINIDDSYAWGTGSDPYRRTSSNKTMPPQGRGGRVAGIPTKSMMLLPDRLMQALQCCGWLVRRRIIWHKPNAVPEGRMYDRPAAAYESVWLLAKQPTYYYRQDKGKGRQDVWSINTTPYCEAHYAVMPLQLAEMCLLQGSKPSDMVLDPFGGSGVSALAAWLHGRRYTYIEPNPANHNLLRKRLTTTLPFVVAV